MTAPLPSPFQWPSPQRPISSPVTSASVLGDRKFLGWWPLIDLRFNSNQGHDKVFSSISVFLLRVLWPFRWYILWPVASDWPFCVLPERGFIVSPRLVGLVTEREKLGGGGSRKVIHVEVLMCERGCCCILVLLVCVGLPFFCVYWYIIVSLYVLVLVCMYVIVSNQWINMSVGICPLSFPSCVCQCLLICVCTFLCRPMCVYTCTKA